MGRILWWMGVSVVSRRVGGRVEVYKSYESDLCLF